MAPGLQSHRIGQREVARPQPVQHHFQQRLLRQSRAIAFDDGRGLRRQPRKPQ